MKAVPQPSFQWLWLPTVQCNDTIQQACNGNISIKILRGATYSSM
jgi:hypothetical protein